MGNGAINGKAIRPFSSSPSSSSLRHLLSSSTSTSFLLSLPLLLLLSLLSKISPYFRLVRAFSFPFNPSMAARRGAQSISAAKGNVLPASSGSPLSRGGGCSFCCKITQKWDKSLEEIAAGGVRRWEGTRGGIDRGWGAGSPEGAARCASTKVGSEETSHRALGPRYSVFITLLILYFVKQRQHSSKKLEEGDRLSSYTHYEISPL